jgi:hypothetical protein
MMGPGFADGIGAALALWVVILIAAAFGLGALAMWGLPKLWAWLLPIIHAATA